MANVLPLVIGGLGLWQASEQNRRQNNAQSQSNDMANRGLALAEDRYNNFESPAMQQLKDLVSKYDPVAESRGAVDAASKTTQEALGKALHGFDARYRAGGGIPGQSSLYAAKQQGVMKPIANDLAQTVANIQMNATLKKADLLRTLLAQTAPGSLSDTYFANSNRLSSMANSMGGGNFGAAAQMFGQGLNNINLNNLKW